MNALSKLSTAMITGIALLLVFIELPAQAATIYSSDFNSATPGQALSSSPLNWSADTGVIRVGTTQHPGWNGNAIDGSLTSPGGSGYAQATIALPAMPTTGTFALTFDAWAYSQYYDGGVIWLNTATSNSDLLVQAWVNSSISGWNIYGYSPFTGNGWQTYDLSHAMQDTTVHVGLFVNYNNNTYWGTFNDGVNSIKSPVFNFVGSQQFTSLSIFEDQRWGSHGMDIANIQISSATPIPAALFFVAPALMGVFGFSCRKTSNDIQT